MSLTSHLFTPNNKLTGQYERKKEERQIKPGKHTKMNAAKIKRQIFEKRKFEQVRLTCNMKLDAHQLENNVIFTDYN